MILTSLAADQFRSFGSNRVFEFDPHFTLIIGPNSVGKTNLLEAVYLISKGHGFRERKLTELVNRETDLASVRAVFDDGSEKVEQEVRLQKKGNDTTKAFYINRHHKPFKEYRSRAPGVVLFEPEDLYLVSGTPSARRQYFDRLLSQTGYDYYLAKNNYERGLYKRNYILEHAHAYGRADLEDLLQFWDEYLGKQIRVLVDTRLKTVAFFNENPHLNGMSFRLDYETNAFVPSSNKEQLAKELRLKRTLTGPQLDEFVFYRSENGQEKNLGAYGSRSEQRLVVLWLKINELKFLNTQNTSAPILLMDDIFSELDAKNSQRILKVAVNYQTIVTTAHLDVLPLFESADPPVKVRKITLGL